MKKRTESFLICFALAVVLFTLLSCSLPTQILTSDLTPSASGEYPAPTESGGTHPVDLATATLTAIPGVVMTETPITPEQQPPTASPTDEPPPAPTPCDKDACIVSGTFLLSRPIGPDGRNTVDTANRYGEFQRTVQEAHHGTDFLNSLGTPVIAAADGTVVAAGNDKKNNYAVHPNTYGSLVILEHELPGISEPLYTLYAHLSKVQVSEGDQVLAGQEIGRVGRSGRIKGSTLHFEVRYEENSFNAVRNPELWLELLADESGQTYGALAGRILDAQGRYIKVPNIVVERLAGPGQAALDQIYLKTYSSKKLAGHYPWFENFAASDLPAGTYKISFWLDKMHQMEVEIEPGKLTVVTFRVD